MGYQESCGEKTLAMVAGRVHNKVHGGLHHGCSRTSFEKSLVQSKDPERSPTCRLCEVGDETVRHLSPGCGKLSKGPHKRRHDRMGLRVYWELCRKYQVQCSDKWFEEVPDTVRKRKDGKFEIWWD